MIVCPMIRYDCFGSSVSQKPVLSDMFRLGFRKGSVLCVTEGCAWVGLDETPITDPYVLM